MANQCKSGFPKNVFIQTHFYLNFQFMFKIFFLFTLLICQVNKSWAQNECLKLQSCVDQSLKTLNEFRQFPNSINSYNPISVQTGSVQCRTLRSDFECIMNNSPYCLRNEMTRNLPNYISQAKQSLDTYCDQSTSWSSSPCYRMPEITQNCESMIYSLKAGSYNYYAASIPRHVCEKYERFRHCVYNALINKCSPMERDLFFSYLYDKLQEISWKCANSTTFFDNYETYHPLNNVYNGMGNGAVVPPPYSYNGNNINQGYNNYHQNGQLGYYDRNRFDLNYPNRNPMYPGFSGQGYGPNYPGYESPLYDESMCMEKVRYMAKQCEDGFIQRQKDARNMRTSLDVQRRICCSIYYYQDCLNGVVLKHCRDNAPSVVSILMGEGRRRELAVSCREYTYEYCSSASKQLISIMLLLVAFSINTFIHKNF